MIHGDGARNHDDVHRDGRCYAHQYDSQEQVHDCDAFPFPDEGSIGANLIYSIITQQWCYKPSVYVSHRTLQLDASGNVGLPSLRTRERHGSDEF